MFVMVSGKRPYPVRTEEFVLVEHARQNPRNLSGFTSAAMPRPAYPKCPGLVGWMLPSSSGMRPSRSTRTFTVRGARSRCQGSMTVVAHKGSRPTRTGIGRTEDPLVVGLILREK